MKRSVIGLAVAVLVFTAAVPAVASIEKGDILKFSRAYSGTSQGPFLATVVDSPGGATDFLTYCVETTEFFFPHYKYAVGDITDASVRTERDLSGYSAWLYTVFRADLEHPVGDDKSWAFKDPVDTVTEYDLLQEAIWAGMLGSSGVVGGSDSEKPISNWTPYTNEGFGLTDFQTAVAKGRWPGENDIDYVMVLNMAYVPSEGEDPDPKTRVQDMLTFYGGDGISTIIPEPASLIAWSLLGCLGVAIGWWRRRKAA